MTGTPKDCTGCAHATRRLKFSQPRTWCQRYRQVRDERCIDYRTKTSAVRVAIDYLKRTSIK